MDSLPKCIRNSSIFFKISSVFFKLPKDLFTFREEYDKKNIVDLSLYYSNNSINSLKRISKEIDINSWHFKILQNYFIDQSPNSLLDVGCGSGYLLNQFWELNNSTTLFGIDYETPFFKKNKFTFIKGDVLKTLKEFLSNSFEFVVCSHVLEHLNNPKEVIKELRRVCSDILIILALL